ncbi:peptide chain release factor 1 [Candidatus Babeliales bacterium]|nr:peptide chain release factor 1 [Candidatus Babeliales bacterium]
MSIQWDKIKERSDELGEKLSGSVDPKERHIIQKEHSQLSSLLEKYNQIGLIQSKIDDAQKEVSMTDDAEMIELYKEEIAAFQEEKKYLEEQLDDVMYPPNPYDKKSVFLEIRSGAGGQEAALFANDLLVMYTNYALSKGWDATVSSYSETDLGGIRDVVLTIDGKGVYGHLKFESGVHRVQRVPKTESSGRVHTSTATVAVLPEVDDIDVTINPADLRIDVYRASGAGGQHVNTTDSAVRITHIPTGVVATCQDGRSQHKNKASAMKMLQSRILSAHEEKTNAQMSEARKELIGRGMRAEKVRTYNYPQNRVTDHQAELTLKKLDVIMTGQIDEIVDALREHDRQERRKKPFTVS